MTAIDLGARHRLAEQVAREAGLLARSFASNLGQLAIEMKGPQDPVTAADRAVEDLIVQRLQNKFPQDAFVGEEGHRPASQEAEALWIIDPIDGTTNFVQGRAEWVVSIGFLHTGIPTIGVVHHPSADATYSARLGKGAMRNGRTMRASATTDISNAVFAFESSLRGPRLPVTETIAVRGGEYRRLGSAALSLALLADGCFDGFIAEHTNAWDVAAGIALVREAGGWTSDFFAGNGLLRGNSMVAAAPGLRDEVLEVSGLA